MRVALLSFVCLVACSSSELTPRQTAGDAGTDSSVASNTFTLEMKVQVPAGKEIFRCQMFQLPPGVDGELFVGGTSHEYTPGSHHYLAFRTSLTSIPEGLDKPFDCTQGGVMEKNALGFVFGGQVPKETNMLPDGVAIPLKGSEIIALQSHYINAKSTDVDATVTLNLHLVDKSKVQQRAGVMRMYDPYIHLPAKADAAAQMRCPVKKDITVFRAVPHMHERGLKQTAFIDPPAERATTPFLVNEDWEHPKDFTGSVPVKAGSSLRFRCDYRNNGEAPVYQGQSATDEMCMLIAFYYPAMEPRDEFCFADAEEMGTGTTSCADSTTCIQKCAPGEAPRPAPGLTGVDVGKCWQECVTASCPKATAPLLKQVFCIGQKCQAECAAGSCTSCALEKCQTEVLACQGLSCE